MTFLQLFENNFSTAFSEMFLVFAICLLLVYGVVFSTSLAQGLPVMTRTMGWLSIQTLAIACLLVIYTPIEELSLFNGVLYHDYFTRFVKTFILLAAIGCLLSSFDYAKKERMNAFEFFILFLIAVLGMNLIVASNDLISMYLAIEMQSLCLYVLAAFKKNSAFSTEAGLKYFILGAFSSGLLLFGASMIYGFTGTTNFEELATICTGIHASPGLISNGIVLGIIFTSSAILFKMAAAPLHMWSPDVYEGAPTVVSAFFAIVPKIAIFSLILKLLMYSLYDFMESWQQLIIICSFTSMVVGAFGALQQKKIKRLLAYSSIGHVGYMLLGLATGTLEGVQGLITYIVIYMVMSLNIWTVVLSLQFQGKQGRAKYLTDLTSLSKINPLLAITIALTMFSMSGVPPLAGFCAKLYVFFSAIEGSLYMLAVVGVLSSCVGAFYYMRLIKVMFFEKSTSWNMFQSMDREKSLVLGFTTLFIMFFFAYPSPLLVVSHKMALSLCL
jgi:proton-translocating NADH-quinone oxidoreductase chain N